MSESLLYAGGALTALWGAAHLYPTRKIIEGFGGISRDNQLVATMEWLAEAMLLIFTGSPANTAPREVARRPLARPEAEDLVADIYPAISGRARFRYREPSGTIARVDRDGAIGQILERERLEHRMRRMQLVISALRDRAVSHPARMGTEPPPLRKAIASFEVEATAVRRRLNELGYLKPDRGGH